LLELKKPKNLRNKDHSPQTICEHLASSFLNSKHGVVSTLSDLNDGWTFFWYAKNEVGSVALHRLQLTSNEGNAAGLAKYILESLYDESRRDTLPTTFLDRLSFDDVMQHLVSDRDYKRARREDWGGGDGSQAKQQANPPPRGGLLQSTPSESPTGLAFGDNSDARGGNQMMQNARALSLFAPQSDVANELDLLDMVDENEQYAMVRSFASRHIVPYMRGQFL
jgi:hypothetical protein